MAEGGRRLARILRIVAASAKPGVRTIELDHLAYDLITQGGDKPAFLGYRPGGAGKPYPATLCASVNDGIVHGLPSNHILMDGDLLKLDLGLIHEKFYLDSAISIIVGKPTDEAKKLIAVTEKALVLGIAAAKAGNTLGDIGHAVQTYVEKNGFSVIRSLTGHGIGRKLHEDPSVYNFGRPGEGERLVAGMTIAIEPMVAAGRYELKQLKDDSFITKDGSLGAHFEHTIVVTEKGGHILTRI
jgi:methionyl aminopeptidase